MPKSCPLILCQTLYTSLRPLELTQCSIEFSMVYLLPKRRGGKTRKNAMIFWRVSGYNIYLHIFFLKSSSWEMLYKYVYCNDILFCYVLVSFNLFIISSCFWCIQSLSFGLLSFCIFLLFKNSFLMSTSILLKSENNH